MSVGKGVEKRKAKRLKNRAEKASSPERKRKQAEAREREKLVSRS
jgi:hypothetical protein